MIVERGMLELKLLGTPCTVKSQHAPEGKMAGVVGSRRDLIFVISELYYEVGGRHFVVGGKIAGCWHILTGLKQMVIFCISAWVTSFSCAAFL